jgi:F420-dependent oxidoreductase-like protein
MIEGQEGVTWGQWVALARACEGHGLEGLFRSDHHLSFEAPRQQGALEAWSTLAALGPMTSRIRLGVLVSPVTFRHPSLLARAVVTADHTSGGRVELGMGAGWFEWEHLAYGFPFPDPSTRLDMLAEQLEIVHGQWRDEAFDFKGAHYRVRDLVGRPAPVQRPHPPLIIGGRAGPRSVALAARFADEYNVNYVTAAQCRKRRRRVEDAWAQAGRDPATLVFSLMTGCVVGTNERELDARLRRLGADEQDARTEPAWITGTVDRVVERLHELTASGVDRVMLQHLAHDDTEMVALLGDEVVPKVG